VISFSAVFVDGEAIAEDEVHITLDEAVFEVMATSVFDHTECPGSQGTRTHRMLRCRRN
jgi:hypothetical protein